MKIGVVCKGEGGVDYHRLIKPFSLLNQEHDVTRCEGVSEEMFDYNFDIVVFSRILPIKRQKEFIRELQKRGTYVICDIDDYWILSGNHVTKKIGDAFRRYSIEALMYSDEVWTTHELLGKEIGRLNNNWHVIPNAIDPNEPQWQPKKVYGNRIGWAGGITHFHDLMLTDGCWGDTIPVVCGFNEHPEWIKLANRFKADYINALPVTEYGLLYDQFDIAIAPLEDNKFNRCKSNLKIIEAGMKGLPIFVENIHPYTDDHKGIFKVDSWYDAISTASNLDTDRIKELGYELRSYVLDNYDLNKVNELRKERLE
jgi:hypothetical protein